MLLPFAVPKSVGKFCSTNHMKPQNRLERIPPRQSSGVWYGKKGRVLVVLNSQYQMLTPALNDPLIEQSTHFPLRMLNLLAMTPPPTANQSNLRFCFEALSSTSPSTGTDQPPCSSPARPLRPHYQTIGRRSGGGLTSSAETKFRPFGGDIAARWGWDMYLSSPLHPPPRTARWAGAPRLFSAIAAGWQTPGVRLPYRHHIATSPPLHPATERRSSTWTCCLVVCSVAPPCSSPWSRLALTFQYDQPNTELQQHL